MHRGTRAKKVADAEDRHRGWGGVGVGAVRKQKGSGASGTEVERKRGRVEGGRERAVGWGEKRREGFHRA